MHPNIRIILTFCFLYTSLVGVAQQVQWLTANPNEWLLNPTTPVDVLCARDPEHVYVAKLDAIAYTYNQPMGRATLSRQGADGAVLWSVELGDTVQVESIASDVEGNVVLGGRYFERLVIGGTAVLTYPADHVAEGSFLCCWDANGQLLWTRDVSGGPFDDVSVASITVDPQERFWAALSTFFSAEITRFDGDGSPVESRSLVESKTIGNISFDPWGGLYIAGAAGSPGITVNGVEFPIMENYAHFVTRLNAEGTSQWLQYAHDITFQKPRVQADASGHAYLMGQYYEPLQWGDLEFADPPWSQAFFLTRLDSTGSFEWGVSPPNASGSGQFTVGHGNALGVDGQGNTYVIGNQGGMLDWGNGVITGMGMIANNSMALISFDDTGIPRWAVQGGSTFTDILYDLAVAPDGVSHFVGITNAPFTLGDFTVDPINGRGTVVGRVDAGINTGLHHRATALGELRAYPAVFTGSFQFIGLSRPITGAIQVELIDAMGRIVERGNRLDQTYGQALASGCYSAQVRLGERIWSTRVVKE